MDINNLTLETIQSMLASDKSNVRHAAILLSSEVADVPFSALQQGLEDSDAAVRCAAMDAVKARPELASEYAFYVKEKNLLTEIRLLYNLREIEAAAAVLEQLLDLRQCTAKGGLNEFGNVQTM